MRVMVVHPGPAFSVADVFTGVCAGLAANDVDVVAYPLDKALTVNQSMYNVVTDHAPIIAKQFDPIAVANQAMIGMAIWKEVDAVLVVTGDHVHMSAPHTLRKAGITTALLCTESPYLTMERERYQAQHYDHVFTNERTAVPLFIGNKPSQVHYLPHAYNPFTHKPEGERGQDCDVFFCGTGFDERQALIAGVDWSGISLQLHGTLWDGVETREQLVKRLMDNKTVAAAYRSARISLNHHRTTGDYKAGTQIAGAESLGPRAYEIAACRGFQLMDDSRAEARDVFGDALTTYKASDSADLEKQIRYWLKHDDRRVETARLQHAAILPHSWTARARQILDVIGDGRGRALRVTKEHPAWQLDMA